MMSDVENFMDNCRAARENAFHRKYEQSSILFRTAISQLDRYISKRTNNEAQQQQQRFEWIHVIINVYLFLFKKDPFGLGLFSFAIYLYV